MKPDCTLGVVLLATMVTLLACEHEENVSTRDSAAAGHSDRGQLGVTSPQAADFDARVVDQMTAARCDREVACGRVGVGRKYSSRRACIDEIRGGIENDINTTNCAHGFYRVMLDRCMAAITSQQCDQPSDATASVDSCRSVAVCLQ
jgi:hypothetical protein